MRGPASTLSESTLSCSLICVIARVGFAAFACASWTDICTRKAIIYLSQEPNGAASMSWAFNRATALDAINTAESGCSARGGTNCLPIVALFNNSRRGRSEKAEWIGEEAYTDRHNQLAGSQTSRHVSKRSTAVRYLAMSDRHSRTREADYINPLWLPREPRAFERYLSDRIGLELVAANGGPTSGLARRNSGVRGAVAGEGFFADFDIEILRSATIAIPF
jgi:hypothetical protein